MDKMILNFASPKDLYYYVIDYFSNEDNKNSLYKDIVVKELYEYGLSLLNRFYVNKYALKALFYIISYSLTKSIQNLKDIKNATIKYSDDTDKYNLYLDYSLYYKKKLELSKDTYFNKMDDLLDTLSMSNDNEEYETMNELKDSLIEEINAELIKMDNDNRFHKETDKNDLFYSNNIFIKHLNEVYIVKDDKLLSLENDNTLINNLDCIFFVKEDYLIFLKNGIIYSYSFINSEEKELFNIYSNKDEITYLYSNEHLIISTLKQTYILNTFTFEYSLIIENGFNKLNKFSELFYLSNGENSYIYNLNTKELFEISNSYRIFTIYEFEVLVSSENKLLIYNLKDKSVRVLSNHYEKVVFNNYAISFYNNSSNNNYSNLINLKEKEKNFYQGTIHDIVRITPYGYILHINNNLVDTYSNEIIIRNLKEIYYKNDDMILYKDLDDKTNIYNFIKEETISLNINIDSFKDPLLIENNLYFKSNKSLYILYIDTEIIEHIFDNVISYLPIMNNIYIYEEIESYFEETRRYRNQIKFEIKKIKYNKITYFNKDSIDYKEIDIINYPRPHKENKSNISYRELKDYIEEKEEPNSTYKEIVKKYKQGETLTVKEKNLIINRIKYVRALYFMFICFVIAIISSIVYFYFTGDIERLLINFKFIMLKYIG